MVLGFLPVDSEGDCVKQRVTRLWGIQGAHTVYYPGCSLLPIFVTIFLQRAILGTHPAAKCSLRLNYIAAYHSEYFGGSLVTSRYQIKVIH